jgi:hypothetical protein
MKQKLRLSESDLVRLVKRVLSEQPEDKKKGIIQELRNKLDDMENDTSYDANRVCAEIANYCNDFSSLSFKRD